MTAPLSNPHNPHTSSTRTTTKLLDALHDTGNQPAWVQIDARYRPVIAGLARRMGLRDTDAEDVAQHTLAEFVRVYREGRYDRAKGRLSSWILGIARNQVLSRQRDARREATPGMTLLSEQPQEEHERALWDQERDRCILAKAMSTLRAEADVDDRTLLAFELVGLRGVPAPEAAVQCAMSVDQVYVAKSRTTKRLRALVEDLTRAFEEDA